MPGFTRNSTPFSRFFARVLAALALLALVALPARAADNVAYLDAAGVLQHQDGVTEITAADCGTTLNTGWYLASGVVTCASTLTINGDVNLILADDASLSVTGSGNAGINVSGANSLTVYAQSTGAHMGSLTANGGINGAGIGGGWNGNGGSITINGGAVTATGGDTGAGIGGGAYGNGGTISIHGGSVMAKGNNGGAGIGGGANDEASTPHGASGDITIAGNANVTATGGDGYYGSGGGGGAGIGSGGAVDAVGGLGTISISTTGTVTATGGGSGSSTGQGGADIGTGGSSTTAGTPAMLVTVTATAGANGGITGPASVAYGGNATYTITPDTGYAIDTLTLDGADAMGLLAGNTLTLDHVTADHAIAVTFALWPMPLGNGSATAVPALGEAWLLLLALLLAGGAAAGMRRGRKTLFIIAGRACRASAASYENKSTFLRRAHSRRCASIE